LVRVLEDIASTDAVDALRLIAAGDDALTITRDAQAALKRIVPESAPR
jgi:hypothetical protein